MRVPYLILFFLAVVSSAAAQINTQTSIRSIVSQPDSVGVAGVIKMGYKEYPDGEFKLIKDNKILSRVYFVKGNPEIDQRHTYWAFQVRGKDIYKDLLKELKKGSVIKEGTRFGKAKTEYGSKDGLFYYPFEDSSLKNLYWVYAAKESLLDQ